MNIQFESKPAYHSDSPHTMRCFRLVQDKLLNQWLPFATVFYDLPRDLTLVIRLLPKKRSRGFCYGMFDGRIGNRPVIEIYHIDAADINDMMRTFFHEVTHLKQWLFDYQMSDRMQLENSGSYWDRPVEVEAREMTDIMEMQFKKYGNNYRNTYKQLAKAA